MELMKNVQGWTEGVEVDHEKELNPTHEAAHGKVLKQRYIGKTIGEAAVGMAREAKRLFDLDALAAQTAGVECRKDEGVLDEIPGAYKDIDAVMAAQVGLVSVEHTLKQVMGVKG